MTGDLGYFGALLDEAAKIATPVITYKNTAALQQKQYEVDLQKAKNDQLATQLQNQVNTTATLQNWYNTNQGTVNRVATIGLGTVVVGFLAFTYFELIKRRR